MMWTSVSRTELKLAPLGAASSAGLSRVAA
jgi:hypothetical protein